MQVGINFEITSHILSGTGVSICISNKAQYALVISEVLIST